MRLAPTCLLLASALVAGARAKCWINRQVDLNYCKAWRGAPPPGTQFKVEDVNTKHEFEEIPAVDAEVKTHFEGLLANQLKDLSDDCKDYARHIACLTRLGPCQATEGGLELRDRICKADCNALPTYCPASITVSLLSGGKYKACSDFSDSSSICMLSQYKPPSAGGSTPSSAPSTAASPAASASPASPSANTTTTGNSSDGINSGTTVNSSPASYLRASALLAAVVAAAVASV